MLARAQRDDERVVRDLIDAVADAMPRQPPTEVPVRRAATPRGPTFEERLQARLAKHRRVDPTDLPQLVRLSIRVEADEEELVAGAVRLVPQVHDEQNPLHLCDLAMLWTHDADEHGFGGRARTHATIALRAAADAWPVLDRLLELRVPDQLVLDTDELVSLLDEGVGALRDRGVDVLWPRSLGRDLSATATLDRASPGEPRSEPLNQPLLGTEALFAFKWQVALHGDPLSDEEMDQLASSATPLMRLRGNWTVVDPAIVRKARKRLLRTVKPAEAVAAALTGTVQVGTDATTGEGRQEQVIVGASLLKVRDQLLTASTREPIEPPAALTATLRDYQRHGLTWLAELTSLGLGACLADDMGLGKTITLIALHLHRHERGATGPTLVVCPASLLGNWEDEVHRFAPGVPVVRFHGSARDLAGAGDGFVLTTYGTMQRDAERLATVGWDLVVADEAQHVKNPRTSTARALRTDPERGAGRAHRHAGREQPDRALGDPRLGDPGAARQPQRLPQGLGRADRVGQGAVEGGASSPS